MRVSPRLGTEMQNRLQDRKWSYRRAAICTGLRHSTIGDMASGLVPGKDHIIDWAVAIDEPINYWLELAGYEPIPARAVVTEESIEEIVERVARQEAAEGRALTGEQTDRLRKCLAVEIAKIDTKTE